MRTGHIRLKTVLGFCYDNKRALRFVTKLESNTKHHIRKTLPTPNAILETNKQTKKKKSGLQLHNNCKHQAAFFFKVVYSKCSLSFFLCLSVLLEYISLKLHEVFNIIDSGLAPLFGCLFLAPESPLHQLSLLLLQLKHSFFHRIFHDELNGRREVYTQNKSKFCLLYWRAPWKTFIIINLTFTVLRHPLR